MIVLDTSAIFALLIPGSASHPWALAHCTTEHERWTSDLARAEFANALWKEVTFKRMLLSDARWAIQQLSRLDLVESRFELSPPFLAMACDLGITAYDAAFVTVAREHRAPLLTLDRRLATRVEHYVDVITPA